MKTKKLTLLLTAAMFLMGGADLSRKDSHRTTLNMVV